MSRVTYWIAYCKVTRMGSTPRLKIDGGIPNRLARVAEAAAALERDGYDGGWTAETSHDPFLPLLLASEHTSRLELGTNIATLKFAYSRRLPISVADCVDRASRAGVRAIVRWLKYRYPGAKQRKKS